MNLELDFVPIAVYMSDLPCDVAGPHLPLLLGHHPLAAHPHHPHQGQYTPLAAL
jgi:hypothetical protein